MEDQVEMIFNLVSKNVSLLKQQCGPYCAKQFKETIINIKT